MSLKAEGYNYGRVLSVIRIFATVSDDAASSACGQ
jgi:hypothetical protein